MIAVAGAMFASCEPELIKGPEAAPAKDASSLEASFVIDGQFADAECKTAQADGNFIKFHTSPATTVQISQTTEDNGKVILYTGPSGVFNITPKRGADVNQPFTVSTIYQNASVASFNSKVTVFVPAELKPEILKLAGDQGPKIWKWNWTTASKLWGNAGNTGNGAAFGPDVVDGMWWGIEKFEEFADQAQHAGGTLTGGETMGAYMVMDEDGNIAAYTEAGDLLGKGSYKVNDYDEGRASGWELGKLAVSEPMSVLFPFSINENGAKVSEYDIMYLDPNFMTLVYTKGNGAGSWGEITYWQFKSEQDVPGNLCANSSRDWQWNLSRECWGNAGNTGAGAAFVNGAVDGQWWGPSTPEGLMDQLNHAVGGAATGAESSDAYMTFTNDTITSYAGDGTTIATSKYEVRDYNPLRNDGWELGKLVTESPAVLFPFSINEGGVAVNEFDIMELTSTNMTLVYTKGNGSGSWGEITFWSFVPKK